MSLFFVTGLRDERTFLKEKVWYCKGRDFLGKTAKFLGKNWFLKGQLFVNHLPFSLFFSFFFRFFFSISISVLCQMRWDWGWGGCKVSPYPQKTAFSLVIRGRGFATRWACAWAYRLFRLHHSETAFGSDRGTLTSPWPRSHFLLKVCDCHSRVVLIHLAVV